MTTIQTWEDPGSLLFKHPMVCELNRLGVTEQQLESLRFWKRGKDCPFDKWPITWTGNLTPAAIFLARAYCALKWIVLDDPPSSPDKDAANRLISEIEIQPIIDAAEKHSHTQSRRAKKNRNKITESGMTTKDVIRRLIFNPELANLKAKELWPHLCSALEEIGAAPRDISSPQDPNSWAYEYETYSGRAKSITVNRRPILTPDRRPMLTPLSDGF